MYVSGKISGLKYEEAFARFEEAEKFLQTINIEPVNPMKNGLPVDSDYKCQMGRDIELLLDCDGIYMLDGWHESKGAMVERFVAKMYGKDIWLEETETTISRVASAVYQVTGMPKSAFVSKDRTVVAHYSRLCFINHCKACGMAIKDIVKAVKRDKFSVFRNLRKYETEYKYNPEFREIADKVNEALNPKDKEQ